MKACESLNTNGSCVKTEHAFLRNINYIYVYIYVYAINSLWPCLHMLAVYWNLSIMFPPAYELTGCTCICRATIWPVTTQRQSTVLWQSHFQGHIITLFDSRAGYFSRHWTNRYRLCCNIFLQGGWERERDVLQRLSASYLVPGYGNLAPASDSLSCGIFNLTPSTFSWGTNRSTCGLIKEKISENTM